MIISSQTNKRLIFSSCIYIAIYLVTVMFDEASFSFFGGGRGEVVSFHQKLAKATKSTGHPLNNSLQAPNKPIQIGNNQTKAGPY